ncbi:MAG: hypothetical protein U5O15_08350 [Candidatus Krumholzibacteriota bacterium]|nr:hypothetical protein [Candidatus Krumholzibacteriota bacterium]
MKRSIPVLAVALLCVCLPAFSYAADRNPFLAEVSAFSVVVENLSPYLKGIGMTEADIQDRVEFLCRRNSFPLNSKAWPWLYVRVTALPVTVGERIVGYAYTVELAFKQLAKTKSNEMYTVASWSARTSLVVGPREALQRMIKDTLQDKVEEFANVWMASHNQ